MELFSLRKFYNNLLINILIIINVLTLIFSILELSFTKDKNNVYKYEGYEFIISGWGYIIRPIVFNTTNTNYNTIGELDIKCKAILILISIFDIILSLIILIFNKKNLNIFIIYFTSFKILDLLFFILISSLFLINLITNNTNINIYVLRYISFIKMVFLYDNMVCGALFLLFIVYYKALLIYKLIVGYLNSYNKKDLKELKIMI